VGRDPKSTISHISLLSTAYVVGHLFYRRDPEKPDQRSFKIQSKKPEFPTKGIKDRVVKLREELACSEEKEVKLPYLNGKENIGRGGLCHICSLILSKESDHRHYRNKNFINLISPILHLLFPRFLFSSQLKPCELELKSSFTINDSAK